MMCLAFSIPFGNEYSRKILVLIVLLWLFTVKLNDIKYIFKQKVIIAFTLYILMHVLSLLWSEHVAEGADFISTFIRYTYIPLILLATVLNKYNLKYIISAFVIGMFINEIISYLIYFNLYQTEYSKAHHWPVGFLNHIPYSVLVAFTAILILFQAKNFKNIFIKGIYIIFFMTMTANLVISGGRTGYAAYFGSLLILLFSYYKITIKNFLELLIFPIIVFSLVFSLDDAIQTRMNASFVALEKIKDSDDYNTSFGTRIAMYPLAHDILKQPENSFLYGAGTGDIYPEMKASNARTQAVKKVQPHLHNSYLTAYVNMGISGLFLFLFLIYSVWTPPLKDKEILFLKQVLVLTIFISAFGDDMLSIKETMISFGVLYAVVLAQEKSEKVNLSNL